MFKNPDNRLGNLYTRRP